MKELEKIVAEAERARASGLSVALATVIGIDGSSYRLPGARMLIVDGKWIAGSISGGCLEDDVVLRAADAVSRNQALVTTYDTTSDDDIVFGVGLGCKGIIRIFIEPMGDEAPGADFIAFAKACLQQRKWGTAATIVRADGAAVVPGERLLSSDGEMRSSASDPDFEARLRRELASNPDQRSRVVTIELQNGSADVFIERIAPPVPLVVFGAGHDAVPVVSLAKEIGWHVTLVDHRPAYATSIRFPAADRILVSQPAGVLRELTFDRDSIALVMTHNYLRDRDLLELLLDSPARYIGLLGPSRRAEELLADLRAKGVHPSPDALGRLYAPVGLDIGSEGPAEVALSILAEMQAVLTTHGGGHLRDRKRPIHQP